MLLGVNAVVSTSKEISFGINILTRLANSVGENGVC